jgi:AcrR family transcriptional regulator
MPKPPAGDTRARILEVAMELFTEQGLAQTSLRQIADRLDITKPALYYHFASRDDLVRSLVQPLIDDVRSVLERTDLDTTDPRTLLGQTFDLAHRHRRISALVVRDLSALAVTDLAVRVTEWRRVLMRALTGPDPSLAQQVRAIVAVGGMADTTIMFEGVPHEELREAALDAACATLGIAPPPD